MDSKSNLSEEELSPTVSRFGRMRKPKISTDFCDIDEIFNVHKQEAKSPPKVNKTVKQTSLLKPVKKLQVGEVKDLVKDLDIYMNAPKQITPLKTEQVSSHLKLVKISGDSIKNRKFFKSKPTETAEVEDDIDVSKVMKLVVGKTEEQQPQTVKPVSGFSKSFIKTYGNKRRVVNRPSLESFGLPDEPIIPLVERNVTKPKRIQSLDVGKPSRDVTLIDSKINSKWQAVNPKGTTLPRFCISKTLKSATKATPDGSIAKKIDDNLRTKKFDLKNVINLNFNTLQKGVIPEHVTKQHEVIELDDDDDDKSSPFSSPQHKNIIIHSNELITPAKKVAPKVKILEDIIFKNSNSKTISNNKLDNQTIKMSDELENISSDQQLFNIEYVNEAPVEDLVDENVIGDMMFDSSKENILEANSNNVPIDSDSICSSVSVENIALSNENTIITFSPDFSGEETVVPTIIDEGSYCDESFDENEGTVFTTVDNNIICPPGQESPVLILIKDGDENIIIESNVEEVEDINMSTSESKDNEESTFEESNFNLQINLENQDDGQELKITEEDGGMIVLDEDMVSQLGEGYIILQGNIDNKDDSAEELAQIAILNPDLKDEIEEGTQYILQCTASDDLEELVLDTSVEESEIMPEENEMEKASPLLENEEINSNISSGKHNSTVEESVKSLDDDNLSIKRKNYKIIREKMRLEAKNLLQSKIIKEKSLNMQSNLQLPKENIDEEDGIEISKPYNEIDFKASPKRNKTKKQQEVLPNKVTPKITTNTENKGRSARTPSKSPVKNKEESSQFVTSKHSKPESPRKLKIDTEKQLSQSKQFASPISKNRFKVNSTTREESKLKGIQDYKKSDEMELLESLNNTVNIKKTEFGENHKEVIKPDDVKGNISHKTNMTCTDESFTKRNKSEDLKVSTKKQNRAPINKKEEKEKNDIKKCAFEQEVINPETAVKEKKIRSFKDKSKVILSEKEKVEKPSKKQKRSSDRNGSERDNKIISKDDQKNTLVQEDLETKDESVKLKSLEEKSLGTSTNKQKIESISINTVDRISEEAPFLKSPATNLKQKSQKSLKQGQIDDVSLESATEHQSLRIIKGKAREVSPRKQKPNIPNVDLSTSLSRNVCNEGKKKSLRSHSEDNEQKVESSVSSHSEEEKTLPEKRKSLRSSQLKDQEPKVTSQIEINETVSNKNKKQVVDDDDNTKDKFSPQKRKSSRFLQSTVQEQILSSTVVTHEVSIEEKDQDECCDAPIEDKTLETLSQQDQESKWDEEHSAEKYEDFSDKTIDKRKSTRFSQSKVSDLKVSTSETLIENILHSFEQEEEEQKCRSMSQIVTDVTSEKIVEKRKSARLSHSKDENKLNIKNEDIMSPNKHKNQKVESNNEENSIFKTPTDGSLCEVSHEKKKCKTRQHQDELPSTSKSNQECLSSSQELEENKNSIPTSASKDQISTSIEEKQMKIDSVTTSDYADKRKSTRLSQIVTQDDHLTPHVVQAVSPDKRKSLRLAKDIENNQGSTRADDGNKSRNNFMLQETNTDNSTDVRKTRSGKDFDVTKQDSQGQVNRKTKSEKIIENKPVGLEQENISSEVSGISRVTRSVKDLEGIKQENISETSLDDKKNKTEKIIEAVSTENVDALGDKRKKKDCEPVQIDKPGYEHSERRKSSRISLTNTVDEKLGIKRLLVEHPNTTTVPKESEDGKSELVEPTCNKNIEVRNNSPNKKDLVKEELSVNKSEVESGVDKKTSEGKKRLQSPSKKCKVVTETEKPSTTTLLKESEEKLSSPEFNKEEENKNNSPNKKAKENNKDVEKKTYEGKKKLQISPKKIKGTSVTELKRNNNELPTTPKISEGKKKSQLSQKNLKEVSSDESNKDIKSTVTKKKSEVKEKSPKIVVRLKNIHNKWMHTKIADKMKKSKLDKQKMRNIRQKVLGNSSPRKDSPKKNEESKKRKAEQTDHKQRKQLHLEEDNKSHQNRRSARVSELKPVSYNEHKKSSLETTTGKSVTSNSLKDIMDDVEYIKRAMLNSTKDDTTKNKEEEVETAETQVTIKQEIVDDDDNDDNGQENPVLFEVDKIKKEIKEEPMDDDISKEDRYFNDGDLAYAKLGHFPYWPCLITREPGTKLFKNLKANNILMYHVRFFGDKGRRSWVRSKHVLPLKSKDDLQTMYMKLKNQGAPTIVLNSYNPNPKTHKMWQVGLNEALTLLGKTIEERYQFFFNMFASEEEKLKNSQGNVHNYQEHIKVEIKTEPEDEIEDAMIESPKKLKKPKYSKSPTRKLKAREIDDDNEVVRKKRGKSLKKEVDADDDVIEITKTATSTPEIKKTHISIIDLSSECSLSDTDSSSRWSIRTPIVCTSENQAALYKRNSLFKGVQRDKVCQKCLKPGEIFKCRGKCFGYYHKECSMFKVKVNVDEEENDSDCQIVLVKDKKYDINPKKLTLSTDKSFREMTLAEQIDFKLKEIMTPMILKTVYADSTSDYTSSEDSSSEKCTELTVEHVAADDVILVNKPLKKKKLNKCEEDFRCSKCASNVDHECFACGQDRNPSGTSSYRQKCSIIACGKFFHPECLKVWPQTQISLHSTSKHKESAVKFDSFSCPMHMCHICISDDPRASSSRLSSLKIVRCLKCPATYHSNTCCIPAGTEIVSSTQIVCPRHLNIKGKSVKRDIINTKWCFICSEGGDLICCETCPTSVHAECSQLTLKDDDTFICEECETGRLPLYDEIVWVKLGKYRWWPALILFPNEVPENIRNMHHQHGEFVVKFFGTHDHYWVHRGRVFLFQEGDEGPGGSKKRMDKVFKRAVEEAAEAHAFKTEYKKNMEDSMKVCDKPPPYIRIKVNKPVGNVKQFDGNISNTTPCNCNPNSESPCGPDSYCINRLLMTECDPEVCPARDKCQNQRIEKRQYPPLVPYKTKGRGWGLKTLAPIKKGEFVIEYVGEVIDDQEYQRRMAKMREQKDDNYYFLTIDKDRMIDAGPKGNMARFMNHCCEPNCETQKWTVKGDTRVCLFAKMDIPENTEVTFNYNLESVDEEKKVCMCGAESCSGFIGVKVKNDEKKVKKVPNKIRKKRSPTPVIPVVNTEPCFYCGKDGETFPCHNKICTKYYHLKCVKLETKPDGKWSCPWHNCNLCSKRTIRCCVKCINSYCPVHSEGNVRHDKLLGFICTEHDPTKEPQEILTNIIKKPRNPATPTEESDVTSTTHEETEDLLDNSSENSSINKLDDTFDDSFEQNESSDKKKRGRRLKKKYPARKRIKLDEPHKNANVLANSVSPPEIILTSSVPERHLRTNRKVSEDSESERLLKRQRAYEKDLPIRKRTTPRTESTENK